MISKAKSKFVKVSPTKLRPFVNGIRGKTVRVALLWLKTSPTARSISVLKTLGSAWANAKDKNDSVEENSVFVSIAKVDQGPTHRYSKPGAMGRGVVQRKRLCHIEIELSVKSAVTKS